MEFSFSPIHGLLQMYRTVKTTDKPASSSGQSDGSGEEDFAPGNEANASLWRFMDHGGLDLSNKPLEMDSTTSSKGAWLQSNPSDMDGTRSTLIFSSQIEDGDLSRSNGLHSPRYHDLGNPSLEFTLGRPDWHSGML